MPKCTICKKDLNKTEAYVVATTSEKTGKTTRKYYCSEEEYNKMIKEREDKNATYNEIMKYFPSIKMTKDLPRVFFMEMTGLAEVHGWEGVLNYLQSDEDYLRDVMNKDFVSCSGKANYLYKVILNRIEGAKIQTNKPVVAIVSQKSIEIDMPETVSYKKKEKKRPSLADMIGDL